jgi:2-(1,2-epoxy-1,2-dihydrophenyl)acetyl-CoA isomerase
MDLYEELRRAGDEEQRSLVTQERHGQRVVLTLADPGRLNSLSAGLNLQLQRHLEEIARDPDIRAVVLTGQDPAFSAGGDLTMIRDGNEAIETLRIRPTPPILGAGFAVSSAV